MGKSAWWDHFSRRIDKEKSTLDNIVYVKKNSHYAAWCNYCLRKCQAGFVHSMEAVPDGKFTS